MNENSAPNSTRMIHSWLTMGLLLLCSCASASKWGESKELHRYEFTQPQMGVPFRIVLYAGNEEVATQAANAAFDRIAQLNAIMSDYDTDSELNELSRTSGKGREVRVSDDLWHVIKKSQELANQSNGAFDITVGPCVSLWRRARRVKEMPDPVRLAEALQSVGYDKVALNTRRQTVLLQHEGMKLDLGGIAKGYAVDEAMKVLKNRGIKHALVGGAGDISVSNPPPGEPGWRISIVDFDAPGFLTNRAVMLKNRAISTSGDSAQRLEINGSRYSHILDPRTGIGLTDHSLVTVISNDSITADSIAKVISVLGPVRGLDFIKSSRGVHARVVREPNDTIQSVESAGFRFFYAEENQRLSPPRR